MNINLGLFPPPGVRIRDKARRAEGAAVRADEAMLPLLASLKELVVR